MSNRHERPRRVALDRADRERRHARHLWVTLREESNGLLEIDVMPMDAISEHPQRHEMTNAIICWIRNSPTPKCMLCDFRWPNHDQPPARFFFARAWHDGPKNWLIAGICHDCNRQPNIVATLTAELQQHCPGGEVIDGSHPAPRGMQ
jgi:hypothetical protein